MRFFALEGYRDVILFLFPSLVFMILFYLGLNRSHFRTKDSAEREKQVYSKYPDGLEDRNAPFPLILILIIVGFLLWSVSYMVGISFLGVKI
jgi:hypothetical protein